MYNVMLSIRSRLAEPDTRHTWLQKPIQFEDAYGRFWPIPVEFDYSVSFQAAHDVLCLTTADDGRGIARKIPKWPWIEAGQKEYVAAI